MGKKLVGLVCVSLLMGGCSSLSLGSPAPSPGCDIDTPSTPYAAVYLSVNALGGSSIVCVSVSQQGELGDLETIIANDGNFAEKLARAYEPHSYDDDAPYGNGELWTVMVEVIGATEHTDSLDLYVMRSSSQYHFSNGSLVGQGAVSNLPSRVVMAKDLDSVMATDDAADGEDHVRSLNAMMPQWAVDKALRHPHSGYEIDALDSIANQWASEENLWPHLIDQSPPEHRDPHKHQPSIYSLGQLDASTYRIGFEEMIQPDLAANPADELHRFTDFELMSTSADKVWNHYFSLIDDSLVFENTTTNHWIRVLIEGHTTFPTKGTWANHIVVFDQADMNFGWEHESGLHIEIDLDSLQVERVIPYGPYSANQG